MRIIWLLTALILSAILAALNFVANENFLYWRYLWLDIPMHLLGGLATSMFVLAVFTTKRPWFFALTMMCAFVGWEVFEYLFKIPQPSANYALDTVKDLLNDTIGAVVAYYLAGISLWKKN